MNGKFDSKSDKDVVRAVLLRLETEYAEELATPVKPVKLRDTIAIWGTRGFTAGCVIGIVLALAIVATSGGVDPVKVLIAIPMAIGVLAAIGATIGMGIGFPLWLFNRK
jgi:hypothetical protein